MKRNELIKTQPPLGTIPLDFSRNKEMCRLLEKHGILSKWHNATWEQYNNDPETKRKIEIYYSKIAEARKDGTGLFVWGENGIGKTHALMCLLKALTFQNNYVVRAVTLGTLCNFYTGGWRDQAKAEFFVELYSKPEFLYVEEPGKEYKSGETDIGRTVMDTVIRYRLQSKKPTLLSFNGEPKKFTSMFSHDVGSMLFEACLIIDAKGEDRRKEINKQLKQKYGF